jgi:hypothetical protein
VSKLKTINQRFIEEKIEEKKETIDLTDLTSFQRLELILIPIIFLMSLIFILLMGLNIIGSEVWIIMGVPFLLGSIIGSIIVYLVKKQNFLNEFNQLEKLFRILVVGGGLALIPLLIIQILGFFSFNFVFSILALIFSLIGTTMGITCILFLHKYHLTRDPSG